MNNKLERAYARGFCKVAAAYGVDPSALAKHASSMTKQAQYAQAAGNGLKALWGGIKGGAKRIGELLGGGNEATRAAVKDFAAQRKAVNDVFAETLKARGEIPLEDLSRLYQGKGQALKGIYNSVITPEVEKELQKVLAARLGVGAAGTVGAYGLGKAMFSEPEPPPRRSWFG